MIRKRKDEKEKRINRNPQRKVEWKKTESISLEVSPFIKSRKEIYINMDDHPQVPIIQ